MADRIRPVILSGGAGPRPSPRETRTEQFQKRIGQRSSFQDTVLRVADRELFELPLVMAHRDDRALVREQLAAIGAMAGIVLEPEPRGSGPALAAACGIAVRERPDTLVLALAADQTMREPALFVAAVRMARAAARAGRMVVFGIKPDRATTGCGYIRPGAMIAGAEPAHETTSFIAKPDAGDAARMVAEGWLWNSRNVLVRAEVLLAEYAEYQPDCAAAVARAVDNARVDAEFMQLDGEAFARAEPQSIDDAVMARTDRAAVVPLDCGWSVIGDRDEAPAASQESGN